MTTMARAAARHKPRNVVERQRLEQRIRRVQGVLSALQDRAATSSSSRVAPVLREAIEGHAAELSRMNHRLAVLRHPRP